MSMDDLPDPAAAPVERISGQSYYMEGIPHRHVIPLRTTIGDDDDAHGRPGQGRSTVPARTAARHLCWKGAVDDRVDLRHRAACSTPTPVTSPRSRCPTRTSTAPTSRSPTPSTPGS